MPLQSNAFYWLAPCAPSPPKITTKPAQPQRNFYNTDTPYTRCLVLLIPPVLAERQVFSIYIPVREENINCASTQAFSTGSSQYSKYEIYSIFRVYLKHLWVGVFLTNFLPGTRCIRIIAASFSCYISLCIRSIVTKCVHATVLHLILQQLILIVYTVDRCVWYVCTRRYCWSVINIQALSAPAKSQTNHTYLSPFLPPTSAELFWKPVLNISISELSAEMAPVVGQTKPNVVGLFFLRFTRTTQTGVPFRQI